MSDEVRKELTVYFAWDDFYGLLTSRETTWFYGGAEMQLQRLARVFAARPDVSVVLLCAKEPPDIDIEGMTTRRIIPKIRRGIPYLSRFLNQRITEKTFAESTPYKLLITSQQESLDILERARQCKVRILYRINGDSLIDGSGLLPEAVIDNVGLRMDYADYLGVLTEYAKSIAEKRFDVPVVLIDSSIVLPAQPSTPSQNSTILWIGRNVALKRPWEFLRLAARLPDFKFVMVAPIGDPSLSRVIAYEAKNIANLTFIEGAPWHEVQELYASSRIVVSTSATEGMPNTLLEASAHGIPYASLDLDYESTFNIYGGGFCAKGNFEVLVDFVEMNMTDDRICDAMGASARRCAQELWSDESASQRLATRLVELVKT